MKAEKEKARGDAASRLGPPQNPVPSPVATTARTSPTEPTTRSRRPALLVITAVVSIALLVAAVVFAMALNPPGGGGPLAATAVDPLLTADEVLPVGAGPWQESSLTASPLCLGAGTPKPDRATSRRLVTSSNDSVLQVANTYADDATAISAYTTIASMLGTCADATALVGNASTVSGLADQAAAVQLTVQATKAENHQVLVARSGRTVNVFDILTANGVPVTTAAQVAGESLSRQCGAGTCPTSISVAASLPATGDPAGWLVSADLPRITPGSGKWTPHDGAVTTPGSHCEGTDLTKISGTTSSAQRTLILTGDPAAPGTFGVDQVVYSFATSKPARTLAKDLVKAIDGCTTRAPTASVKQGADVKGAGEDGAVVSGNTWEVTHKSSTFTYIYRVAVVTVGNQVTYLVATPSKDFDFTDAQWGAIALRAGQRASQAG